MMSSSDALTDKERRLRRRCESCGGRGGHWIAHRGRCWTVRRITSEGLCAFCRNHPTVAVTAEPHPEARRRAKHQREGLRAALTASLDANLS